MGDAEMCKENMGENTLMDSSLRKGDLAQELYEKGYNCCQAVLGAFSRELGLDEKQALMLASSFGGGMGKLREVCGAVTAMFMIAGYKYGYSDVNDKEAKEEHYRLIQKLGEEFKKKNGSIICRELLNLNEESDTSQLLERKDESGDNRPCPNLVRCGAEIIEREIKARQAKAK